MNTVCPKCGGTLHDLIGEDGAICDTCYLIVKSDGSYDTSEMEYKDGD